MAPEEGTPTPTLDELLDQERRLVLPSLDENGAIEIGVSILRSAIERNLPVTIEVRLRDRVVFRAARNGTDATNDLYIGGKARLVERFGHASLYERLRYEAEGTSFEEATGLARVVLISSRRTTSPRWRSRSCTDARSMRMTARAPTRWPSSTKRLHGGCFRGAMRSAGS